MNQRNPHWKSKCSKHHCSVFDVLVPVYPFEQTNEETSESDAYNACEIYLHNCKVTIKRVIEWREWTTSYQKTYSCKVKSEQESIGIWIETSLLLERGWKRWKIVLKRRHRTAEVMKTKMGHFEISWGLGASGWRSIFMNILESRKCFNVWALFWIVLINVKLSWF